MAINKEDKSFKILINKEFTDPNRAFFQENTVSTLDINDTEVYTSPITSDTASAISNGFAKQYTEFILTPDGTFPNNAFYFISGSGFTPGSDSIPSFSSNPELYQRNFLSDKYGANYEIKLFENDGTQIFKTDPINWIFDYKTGILHIADPGGKSTPYKVSILQYTGETLSGSLANERDGNIWKQTGSAYTTQNNIQITGSLGVTGGLSGSFSGSGADLSGIPASGIVGLELFKIQSGSVSTAVDVGSEDIFTVNSGSIKLVSLQSNGDFKISGSLIAEQLVISSSVMYMTQSFSSGSTIFGDTFDDTHQFTGSLFFTGSGTYTSMSQATYSEIAYQDSRGGLRFSHVIDGGSF
jgi:hypothetical protein